jgi:mRNA-degrading endonuclease RelE of RelBE toxin-antitoxin system
LSVLICQISQAGLWGTARPRPVAVSFAIAARLYHTRRPLIQGMKRRPFWSQFCRRVDDFRVYYDVDEENRAVNVLRVLKKGTQPTENRSDDENRHLDR